MPELRCGRRSWTVAAGSNLLDELNSAGLNVPYSCRAGSCHACLVRCLRGEPEDARPGALDPGRRDEGWRLACQCSVIEDLEVAVFDPAREGQAARVLSADWLGKEVLRLRLQPEQPFRYRAGQHVLLWSAGGIARPYSFASLPGEDPWLEFHLDCRLPGAFRSNARLLSPGDHLQLGQLHEGPLHYDGTWQARPLLLLAAGTGLAPLLSVLREALRQAHSGPIRLLHLDGEHSYASEALESLAGRHDELYIEAVHRSRMRDRLRSLRISSRQEVALICGGRSFVEACTRRMYMAGLPRGQILSDTFVTGESKVVG